MKKTINTIKAIAATLALLSLTGCTVPIINKEDSDSSLQDSEISNVVQNCEILAIDITESGININGTVISIPVELDTLTALLGEPTKAVEYQTPQDEIPDYMLEEFPELLASRVNYAWDELGVFCYTTKGHPAHCFGILTNPSDELGHYPAETFSGELTINGEEWHKVIRSGIDMEVFRSFDIGGHSLVGCYADYSARDNAGKASDYTSLEISAIE